MKKIIITIILIFISTNITNACMPFTPELIVIGEYNGKVENELPYGNYSDGRFQFIDLLDVEKPFSKSYKKLGKYYYSDTSRIELKDYIKGDLLITVSDYNNGDYENYFNIYEVGKISCKNIDEFFIENKQGVKKTFGKEMWQCGNYKSDNVQSEEELLQKIKEKYKNCENIGINNTTYTRNVDDDYKIYKFDEKIGKIIEKSANPELLKEKIIDRIKKLLGISNEDLNKIYNFKNYELKSFREYALIKVYRYLLYGDNLFYSDSKPRIIENDFVKLVVTLPNIHIDNESVYLLRKKGIKWKMIEFFKIESIENIEEYIDSNFIDKEYIGKCRAYIRSNKYINFNNNLTYGIGAYGDYISKERHPGCGYYGDVRFIQYFEVRGDYLIFVNAGQDYNGVDFSLIEFK